MAVLRQRVLQASLLLRQACAFLEWLVRYLLSLSTASFCS